MAINIKKIVKQEELMEILEILGLITKIEECKKYIIVTEENIS